MALWNSFKKLVAAYTPEERADMYCNTATRVQRLDGLGEVLKPS